MKLNRLIVNDHFLKLRELLISKHPMARSECIYNIDEKGCRLSLHKDPSVYAKKGSKRVHYIAKEHGESVTIVACGNAIGAVIPPMILFSGKRMKPEWKDNLPPGSQYQMTPKGSMTTDTFVTWLQLFARFKSNGPCVLIFDGVLNYILIIKSPRRLRSTI